MLGGLFPFEPAATVKAAQDAFAKNAQAVVNYACRSMLI